MKNKETMYSTSEAIPRNRIANKKLPHITITQRKSKISIWNSSCSLP